MPPRRTILVVDPDAGTADAIGPALRRRGHHVYPVRDGSRALQHALARSPDLILLDEDAPLIGARTLVRILRSNPRTRDIPVIPMGRGAQPDDGGLGPLLQKPLDLDEVIARVDQIFRRLDVARAAASNARLEGSLSQLPLPDLLQVLGANRRTGRVTIEHEGARGEIRMIDGQVSDAAAGHASGEKALFRLLALRAGRFSFVPGGAAGAAVIERRLEDLLLDAARRADELAALASSLPSPGELLGGTAAGAPAGLDPVAADVARLLASPRTFREILDGSASGDLEVARAVAELLRRGDVRREAPRPEVSGGAPGLLDAAQVQALRARLLHGRSRGAVVGKVVVAGGGPLARRVASARFATLRGFVAAEGAPRPFGAIGRLAIDDGLALDLVALPADAALRPLWGPLAAGALAALVLVPAGDVAAPLAAIARASRLHLGVCAPSPDAFDGEALRALPGSCPWLGNDPAQALRALLSSSASESASA